MKYMEGSPNDNFWLGVSFPLALHYPYLILNLHVKPMEIADFRYFIFCCGLPSS